MWASWLLGDVVHARVHAEEAAPSLAAADALFDQLFQLHQRGDGRAAVAEGSRQVAVGVGSTGPTPRPSNKFFHAHRGVGGAPGEPGGPGRLASGSASTATTR